MPVDERALSDAQLLEMMGLLKGSDTVELKVTIPARGARSVVASLGMDPMDAQLRSVVFFDTPDLTLNEAGVVVRARRIQGKRDDTVIKLRPVVPEDLPEEMRQPPALGVEVDATPEGFVCSASMKGLLGSTEVRRRPPGSARSAGSSRRSSVRSTTITLRADPRSTTCRSSVRSTCSS